MPLEDWQRKLYPLLAPCGFAYAAVMAFRRRLFELERLKAVQTTAPCVSVGNLRMGGSGKTPLVKWLIQWAAARNLRTVVLTRGYRAKPPWLPYLVDPSTVDATETGDEPLLLARASPEANVIVDPIRSRSALWAAGEFAPQLYLLDDGFQHLAVKRQADLMLLTLDDLRKHWNRVFPAGPWREDASAVYRAAAVLVKCPPENREELDSLVARHTILQQRPVFPMHLEPRFLLSPKGTSTPNLSGREYLLASGVADPESVGATAATLLGKPPKAHVRLCDHAAFSRSQRQQLLGEARKQGLNDLVCTEKDAVKLFPHNDDLPKLRLWSMMVEPVFGPGVDSEQTFPEFWEQLWARLRRLTTLA